MGFNLAQAIDFRGKSLAGAEYVRIFRFELLRSQRP
jgi:hypothetical protein